MTAVWTQALLLQGGLCLKCSAAQTRRGAKVLGAGGVEEPAHPTGWADAVRDVDGCVGCRRRRAASRPPACLRGSAGPEDEVSGRGKACAAQGAASGQGPLWGTARSRGAERVGTRVQAWSSGLRLCHRSETSECAVRWSSHVRSHVVPLRGGWELSLRAATESLSTTSHHGMVLEQGNSLLEAQRQTGHRHKEHSTTRKEPSQAVKVTDGGNSQEQKYPRREEKSRRGFGVSSELGLNVRAGFSRQGRFVGLVPARTPCRGVGRGLAWLTNGQGLASGRPGDEARRADGPRRCGGGLEHLLRGAAALAHQPREGELPSPHSPR